MSDGYALRYLQRVMGWSFEADLQEAIWLRMMSDFKYDSYRDFWAGSRFAEALLNWLQQFQPSDRQAAYDFFRRQLIFISFAELQHLVNRTLSVYARNVIVDRISIKAQVPKYMVWAHESTQKLYKDMLARTLFIGLSDGARIDGFRRANAGVISNEQVALGYELSSEKWDDIKANLRSRTNDTSAKFEVLFLVDDFIGSGNTLLRKKDNGWSGKLKKFAKEFSLQREIFTDDCTIAIHHYIGTELAKENIDQLLRVASANGGPNPWFPGVIKTTFDLLLSNKFRIIRGQIPEIDRLVDRYYDPAIETVHTRVGGTDAKFGFSNCGLPLILEHNTPNNSLALLWAESPLLNGAETHTMRPLFRRRQRHT